MPVSEEVCACGFEFLRTFLRIFVFVNEEVCEIVLIKVAVLTMSSTAIFYFKVLM